MEDSSTTRKRKCWEATDNETDNGNTNDFTNEQ